MAEIQDRPPEELGFMDVDQNSGILIVSVNKVLSFHTIFFRYWNFIVFFGESPFETEGFCCIII